MSGIGYKAIKSSLPQYVSFSPESGKGPVEIWVGF
jgi:hypothetical protein